MKPLIKNQKIIYRDGKEYRFTLLESPYENPNLGLDSAYLYHLMVYSQIVYEVKLFGFKYKFSMYKKMNQGVPITIHAYDNKCSVICKIVESELNRYLKHNSESVHILNNFHNNFDNLIGMSSDEKTDYTRMSTIKNIIK